MTCFTYLDVEDEGVFTLLIWSSICMKKRNMKTPVKAAGELNSSIMCMLSHVTDVHCNSLKRRFDIHFHNLDNKNDQS